MFVYFITMTKFIIIIKIIFITILSLFYYHLIIISLFLLLWSILKNLKTLS